MSTTTGGQQFLGRNRRHGLSYQPAIADVFSNCLGLLVGNALAHPYERKRATHNGYPPTPRGLACRISIASGASKEKRGTGTLQCMTSVIISLHTKGFSGSYVLLINYYNFNYGDFSGMPVLQRNSTGEASGKAFFLPAWSKTHIGARRAQSENLMNSLCLCAEWRHTFFP